MLKIFAMKITIVQTCPTPPITYLFLHNLMGIGGVVRDSRTVRETSAFAERLRDRNVAGG
jgi:hypothetical protein